MKAAVVHRLKPATIVEEQPILAPLVVEAALSPQAPGLPNTGIRATECDLPIERARPFCPRRPSTAESAAPWGAGQW